MAVMPAIPPVAAVPLAPSPLCERRPRELGERAAGCGGAGAGRSAWAGCGSSLEGAYGGNSDPVECVVSGLGSY